MFTVSILSLLTCHYVSIALACAGEFYYRGLQLAESGGLYSIFKEVFFKLKVEES